MNDGLATEISRNENFSVAAAQSGWNGEAFEILAHRHRAKMLRAALRFTRNEADAEDIVQQSFVGGEQ